MPIEKAEPSLALPSAFRSPSGCVWAPQPEEPQKVTHVK
jgi:hypothetical protein